MSLRVLLITTNPPIPSQGGSMLLYRHFCERDDFQISVITNDVKITQYSVPYEYSVIEHSKIWNRLLKTRFYKHFHSFEHLYFGNRIPRKVKEQAENFRPDIVFSIAGSWSWTTRLAQQVSHYLGVPFVGSFMDWWHYNLIYASWSIPLLESNFKKIYRQCDLALCISEGMQKELGELKNSVVIYPIGSVIDQSQPSALNSSNQNFTLAFAGNLGEWYGKMLERLITFSIENNPDVNYKVFGSNQSWSDNFENIVKNLGIYQGQIPIERLRKEIQSVDALILLMGFDEDCAQIERTSFKSKFLDYVSFQKPILVWGPEYCTAVNIAREYDSAEICTSPVPKDFMCKILSVKENKNRQQELIENSQHMYLDRFHPDKIHNIFVDRMENLFSKHIK